MNRRGVWRRAFGAIAALAIVAAPARAVPPAVGGALASDNVELVATIPDPGMIGAEIIGDVMYATGAGGLRVYSLADDIPVPIGALELPSYQNEDVDTNGEILLIASDHLVGAPNLLYVIDVSFPHLPTPLATMQVSSAHTATCLKGCTWAWLGGDGGVGVVDLRDPREPVEVARIGIADGSYVHDVQVDDAGIAWVSSGAGLFAYDVDDPRKPVLMAAARNGARGAFENDSIVHNSLRPQAKKWKAREAGDDAAAVRVGELVLATEEDWLSLQNDLCENDGVFQTGRYLKIGSKTVVERLDTFHIGRGTIGTHQKAQPVQSCSSHYFGYRTDGLVAVAWYEQGTRLLDVSDPRAIRQVGYFMPVVGEAISAHIRGDLVYVFDTFRGVDVLRVDVDASSPDALAPSLAPRAFSAPTSRWGWACRLAPVVRGSAASSASASSSVPS